MSLSDNDINNDLSIQRNLVRLNYYIVGLGGSFMFCIGILTNIINLIVFSRRAMKTTTNKYLTALAICDIFVLIFSQLITSNSFISNYNKTANSFSALNLDIQVHADHSPGTTTANSIDDLKNQSFKSKDFYNSNATTSTDSDISYLSQLYYSWSLDIYNRIYPYAYPFAILFQISTVWINIGMSVDRFFAIHFPLRSLKYCTISNAKRVIKFIFLFGIIYSLPRFFEYRTIVDYITLNNETYSVIYFEPTQIGQSNLFKKIVYFWMYLFFQSIVPLIILTLLNFSLVYSVKASGKFINKFNTNYTTKLSKSSRTLKVIFNKEKTRKETTIMLISVVILFVLLQTPSVVCNFLHSFNTKTNSSFEINALCYVGNFLIMTNSATNFFSYCLFNRRFRQEFTMCMLRLFCKSLFIAYKRRKRLSVSISYNNFVYNLKKYHTNKKGASQTSLNIVKRASVVYYTNNQVKLVYNNDINTSQPEENIYENNRILVKLEEREEQHEIDEISNKEITKYNDNTLKIQNSISNHLENSCDEDDLDKISSDNNIYNFIQDNEITESNVAYV